MSSVILLNWMSELITGIVIVFTLINAIKSDCFSSLDWGLTAASLVFALFVKIIADVVD